MNASFCDIEPRQEGTSIMECKKDQNRSHCNCSYGNCTKKGVCCDCVAYHIRGRQVPACFFPGKVERTYDRSFERFAQLVQAEEV